MKNLITAFTTATVLLSPLSALAQQAPDITADECVYEAYISKIFNNLTKDGEQVILNLTNQDATNIWQNCETATEDTVKLVRGLQTLKIGNVTLNVDLKP